MDKLEDIRKSISEIDVALASLFERRMEQCAKVAQYKKERGLCVEDPAREAELIGRGGALIRNEAVREYYPLFQQSIMDISKKYQYSLMDGLKIACCADSKAMASQMYPGADIVEYPDYQQAYASCETGASDVAVLPLEDSRSGEVSAVLDLMFAGSLYINRITEQEDGHSTLRYAAFSRAVNSDSRASGRKSSRFILMFTVCNEAGSLAKTLNIIGIHGFNMSCLRSRPMKGLKWNYYFYLELDGNIYSEDGSCMLQELGTICDKLKLAGSF